MSTKRTLDTHYTDKIQEYEYYHQELVAAREKLSQLDPGTDEYTDTKKRIEELEEKCEDEIDYYTNTASILFNYYNIVENNIEEPVVNNVKDMNKGILKYFIKTEEKPASSSEDVGQESKKSVATKDKATLLEEYIAFTSSNYVKNMTPDASGIDKDSCGACGHCGSMNRVTMITDSIICCYDCHSVEHIIVDHEKPSYKESPREISYYSYRRINHLNESIIIGVLIIWLS